MVLGMVLLVPVVLYYILKNFYEIRERIKSFLLHHKQNRLYHALKESEEVVKGYVSGTLLVSLVLSIIASIYFSIIGLEYCFWNTYWIFKYYPVCWASDWNHSSCYFWIDGFSMDTSLCHYWSDGFEFY